MSSPHIVTGRAVLALAVLLAGAAPALAQTSVTQNPPVPSRPPVTAGTSPVVSDAPKPPPDQIAAPATTTAGPGLAGGAAGAPLTGAQTQVPARSGTQR